jgi:feruloyl esterase
VLTPAPNSHIEMELWLPANASWNGKFLAVGNGGFAGSISFAAMADGLAEGYATASNDTGHKGGGGEFALVEDKLVDFAYRAMHEMTVQSKAIVQSYYTRPARLSYYAGCSTGGRQGLVSAQRYPADFDAIIAGAAVNPMTYLDASHMRRAIFVTSDPGYQVSAKKLELVTKAVTNACDTLDGVKDGILADPRMCKFDVASLACSSSSAGSDSCLTPREVESVKFGYSDAKRSNGELIYPGFAVGSESVWLQNNINATTGVSGGSEIAIDMFKFVGNQDPKWDWKTFNLEKDLALAVENGGFIDGMETNLTAFKARGGKLLLYHGWNDQRNPAENSINYYSKVLKTMGTKQDEWLRLFMVPGMNHCSGGVGPSQIDYLSTMERWREAGQSPASITAYRVRGHEVDMTRPVCAYPNVAKWTGVGSTNDAANFKCVAP